MEIIILSIGALSKNPFWNERLPVRTSHATTTLIRTTSVDSPDKPVVLLVDPSLPAQILDARLDERAGIKADAVTHVFLTNWRPIHRRALEHFAKATWWMSQLEIEAANDALDAASDAAHNQGHAPDPLIQKERSLLAHVQPAPDELADGIDFYPLPGYTAGQAGLLVSEPTRTTLVTGDAVPTAAHFLGGQVFPDCWDLAKAKESLLEMYEIADVIVPGHDNLFFAPRSGGRLILTLEPTMHRNLSVDQYFLDLAGKHVPKYRFKGKTRQDWKKWSAALDPAVKQTLGIMPRKVPLKPEILAEWTEDGLIKQRIIFDVEDGLSATAYLFRPQNATGSLPAILCCHGHGPHGKETVMGNRSSVELLNDIARTNYDYGLQMAKPGFVTIAIDWRGFGERDDRKKPHFHNLLTSEHMDYCALNYERATIMGMTVLGMDIHDGKCALDYLAQEFVDRKRIGAMGLSFGGTMTTWMTICDSRIRAADIICYSDRFTDFAIRDANACGSQVTPGLFALCDVPDLQGLIAPRPLLIEIGTYDNCFLLDSAMSCYRELEKIYAAAQVRDRLDLDLFEGGHRWGANKSVAFFERWLP